MSPTWLLSVFALIVITVGRVLGEFINLGDSFKFTTNETCGNGEMMLIRLLKTSSSPVTVTVARRVHGVWEAEGVYKGRIEHESASSFYLTSLNFNDNGLHEFTCAVRDIGRIDLTVIIPPNIPASEGQTTSLPCHSFTAGKPVKRVRWESNGALVLEQDRSSGEVRHGPGFEGRASVAPDWYLTGNMSMKLEQIKLEDQGEFICYAVDEDGRRARGSPRAVKMLVDKRNTHHITFTPQPAECGATEERAMGAGVIFSIALNVVLFIAAAIFCYLWLRSRRSAHAGRGPSTNGTAEEMTSFNGTGPPSH